MIGYYWEFTGQTISSLSCDLLAPWVVSRLDLMFNASTCTYFDNAGKIATKVIIEQDEESSNNKDLFYIRKDLLNEVIKQEQLDIGYNIYGERRLARVENLHSDEKKSTFKEFRKTLFIDE